MGASKPWQDVVRQLTRGKTNRIDAGAMLTYFEPLNAWLKRQNEMQPVIGWISSRDDRGWLKFKIFLTISSIIQYKVQSVSCENRNFSICFSTICAMVSEQCVENRIMEFILFTTYNLQNMYLLIFIIHMINLKYMYKYL